MNSENRRCPWCLGTPLYERYHDEDWGVPVHDDRMLFEMLILEGAQAGLSWLTILKKRENYRRAFKGFEISAVARMDASDEARLLQDAGIVRHRQKISAAIGRPTPNWSSKGDVGSSDPLGRIGCHECRPG